ncbi:hypothetical protein L9F63_001970, partial [Diploptera punctata]
TPIESANNSYLTCWVGRKEVQHVLNNFLVVFGPYISQKISTHCLESHPCCFLLLSSSTSSNFLSCITSRISRLPHSHEKQQNLVTPPCIPPYDFKISTHFPFIFCTGSFKESSRFLSCTTALLCARVINVSISLFCFNNYP